MLERQRLSLSAINDFRRARQQESLDSVIASLTGRSRDLLSFEDVKRKLKANMSGKRELKDIPLAAIVGSVGRYGDFNRQFLPRLNSDEARWARVKAAMESQTGVPPIEVYQIDQAYFVLDGNHRVSVQRQMGSRSIQAYVTEVQSRVPLSPDASPDDLILKAEYAEFLDHTALDEQRPHADLGVTSPGRYAALEEEIAAIQAAAAKQGQELTIGEAAASWYDTMYLPVIEIIRSQGILHDFPNRTETDLYVWIAQHRAELQQELGWDIAPTAVATDLASQRSQQPRRIAARFGERLRGAFVPDALAAGPPPGEWRKDRRSAPEGARLVAEQLVPVSGEPNGWLALDQAIVVAQHEGGRIAGLHVVRSAAARTSDATQALRTEFDRRCQAAGVSGTLAVEVGAVTDLICDRARWNDMVVVHMAYPPGTAPIARLRNGFRALIQRCPRPILAVPQAVSPLRRVLLAYDGSPKAQEALYAATYLALQWQVSLTVLSVGEAGEPALAGQARAAEYLQSHGVSAAYLTESGPVAPAILRTAAAQASDMLLMGGYGLNPVFEMVIGSSVDQVLRETQQPVLICR